MYSCYALQPATDYEKEDMDKGLEKGEQEEARLVFFTKQRN